MSGDICGRRPLHGTGDVWCVLKPRHVGLHEGDGGESFIRVEPGVRVNAEGHLVAIKRKK